MITATEGLHGCMIVPSEKSARILVQLQAFMSEHIYPNEVAHQEALAGADNRFASMPLVEFLKDKARSAGLWNLFVPCLLYTSPSPRDATLSRMPSSA